MKKMLAIALSALISLSLLAGCAATPASSSAAAASAAASASETEAAPKEVTLRMAWWGSQARNDNTVKVIEMFMKEYPHIKIDYEFADFGGHFEKLATLSASNNLPDIIQQDYGYLTQYAEKGLLADLTPFLESKTIDTSDITETFISGGKVNGKYYGLSTGVNALSMVYDTDMAAKAGVTVPTFPTWDELYEICKTVKEKAGMQSSLFFNYFGYTEILARGLGKQFYAPDGKSLGFEDAALVEKPWEFSLNAVNEGISPSAAVYTEAGTTIETGVLATGKTWNAWTWSNLIGAQQTASGKSLGVCAYPTNADDTTPAMFLKPAMFFSIAQSSAHKEEAALFLNYFTTNIEAFKIMGTDRGIPVSSAVRNALKADADETTAKVFAYIDEVANNSSAIAPPYPAAGSEVDALYSSYAEKVLYNQISVKEAAEKFMSEANALLAK